MQKAKSHVRSDLANNIAHQGEIADHGDSKEREISNHGLLAVEHVLAVSVDKAEVDDRLEEEPVKLHVRRAIQVEDSSHPCEVESTKDDKVGRVVLV